MSHQYVVQERLWGIGLQHGFPLALTTTFWKPVAYYNKGKLNISNWVYWRSIGLSLTSVGLLGSMSLVSILPNTSRHCPLLSLFILPAQPQDLILLQFLLLLLLLLSSSSSFCQHRYFSNSLHGMTMWLRYIHKLDDRYKIYGSRNSLGVIWGHRGQKG